MDFLLHVVATAAAAAFCLLAGSLNILMRFLEFYGKTGERRASKRRRIEWEKENSLKAAIFFILRTAAKRRRALQNSHAYMRVENFLLCHETVSLHSKKGMDGNLIKIFNATAPFFFERLEFELTFAATAISPILRLKKRSWTPTSYSVCVWTDDATFFFLAEPFF